MNIPLSKAAAAGALFLFIFFTGYWLHRSGRPFNGALLNIHKLIGLATAVFLFITFSRLRQMGVLTPPALTAGAAAGLFFAAVIVTGGLVSLAKPAPAAVSFLHNLLPYLTVLSSAAALYLAR